MILENAINMPRNCDEDGIWGGMKVARGWVAQKVHGNEACLRSPSENGV
jgi:hypothetical protein